MSVCVCSGVFTDTNMLSDNQLHVPFAPSCLCVFIVVCSLIQACQLMVSSMFHSLHHVNVCVYCGVFTNTKMSADGQLHVQLAPSCLCVFIVVLSPIQ